MRRFLIVALIISLALISPVAASTTSDNQIIRIHVLAHNDTGLEQGLKLLVRDAVLVRVSKLLQNAASFAQAETIIGSNLPLLKEIAEETLRTEGSSHGVSLQWGTFLFPTRVYGQTTLPAGRYPALNIHIGDGQGKNWWCVMYPPLCHVEGVVGKGQETRYELALVNLIKGLWQRIWS